MQVGFELRLGLDWVAGVGPGWRNSRGPRSPKPKGRYRVVLKVSDLEQLYRHHFSSRLVPRGLLLLTQCLVATSCLLKHVMSTAPSGERNSMRIPDVICLKLLVS